MGLDLDDNVQRKPAASVVSPLCVKARLSSARSGILSGTSWRCLLGRLETKASWRNDGLRLPWAVDLRVDRYLAEATKSFHTGELHGAL